MAALCGLAREHTDRAEQLLAPLVTALRLLAAAAVPPDTAASAAAVAKLRYRYALTQLYAADGLVLLLAVLRRLAEAHGQPALHAAALAGHQGLALTALLRPAVLLLTPVAPLVDTSAQWLRTGFWVAFWDLAISATFLCSHVAN